MVTVALLPWMPRAAVHQNGPAGPGRRARPCCDGVSRSARSGERSSTRAAHPAERRRAASFPRRGIRGPREGCPRAWTRGSAGNGYDTILSRAVARPRHSVRRQIPRSASRGISCFGSPPPISLKWVETTSRDRGSVGFRRLLLRRPTGFAAAAPSSPPILWGRRLLPVPASRQRLSSADPNLGRVWTSLSRPLSGSRPRSTGHLPPVRVSAAAPSRVLPQLWAETSTRRIFVHQDLLLPENSHRGGRRRGRWTCSTS